MNLKLNDPNIMLIKFVCKNQLFWKIDIITYELN